MPAENIEAERARIREIMASHAAKMNPKLADVLAYDSKVSASVAVSALANSVEPSGRMPTNPGGARSHPCRQETAGRLK
jgi:hypothetical protein